MPRRHWIAVNSVWFPIGKQKDTLNPPTVKWNRSRAGSENTVEGTCASWMCQGPCPAVSQDLSLGCPILPICPTPGHGQDLLTTTGGRELSLLRARLRVRYAKLKTVPLGDKGIGTVPAMEGSCSMSSCRWSDPKARAGVVRRYSQPFL